MCKTIEILVNQGEKQGEKKGMKKQAVATAKKMLKSGTLTREQIAEFTELDIAKVEPLAEQITAENKNTQK